jgi:hypothetical protein
VTALTIHNLCLPGMERQATGCESASRTDFNA